MPEQKLKSGFTTGAAAAAAAKGAMILLLENRKPESVEQIDLCRTRHGDHPWVLMRSGTVQERTGDRKGALRSYEAATERARESGNREDLRFAYDALIRHLQDSNQQSRATEVTREMLEELPELEEEFRTEQIINEVPKVGRNDPCPCGSGRKFKKCCAREGSS